MATPQRSPHARIRSLLGCFLLLPLLSLAPPVEDPRSGAVDRLFAQWDRHDSPGAAVLVMKDGEIVHRRGYGLANLEHRIHISPSTVFDIASVSKQFAGYAIAVLAEEGRISLDDDVRRYVPELHDFGHTITIRHLVHHTSGLRDWPGTLRMAGWDYGDIISYDQILRMAFNQRELNFTPGDEYAYSNTGYNLLAEIVARVSGETFREWTHRRIFEPLGMLNSHFHDDHDEVVANRAASYRPAGDATFRRITNNLTALGSSSLFTTVDDLARWVRHLEEGSRNGNPVVRRMLDPGMLNDGSSTGYAYGINVGEWRGVGRISHGGSWAGHRSTLTVYPYQGLAVIILSNVSNMNPGSLAGDIAEIYAPEALEPVSQPSAGGQDGFQPTEPYRVDTATLLAYAGEYRSAELHTAFSLEVDGDALVARHFRLGDATFRPTGEDRFQAPRFGQVAFLRDDAGRVIAFTANSARIRNLRFERVP